MMGRVVVVLCLLVGVANACPIGFETPEQKAAWEARMEQRLGEERSATPTAAQLSSADPGSGDRHGAALACALMGLCAVAFALTRANAVRRTFATSHLFDDSNLELMRAVARTQRMRTGVFAAGCVAATLVVSALPIEPGARALLAVTPTLLLAISLVAMCRLQLLIGLRAEPTLSVRSHGHHLFASRGRRLVGWVEAPPQLVARASGFPIATVRS
jgi:hypothetical protein